MHWAAERGHEAVVRLLLELGAYAEAKDGCGWTVLHSAAQNGHEAVVRLLVEKGMDVEAKDYSGKTALRRATENKHEAVAWLLLESKTSDWIPRTPINVRRCCCRSREKRPKRMHTKSASN